jgi:hypothetical protein
MKYYLSSSRFGIPKISLYGTLHSGKRYFIEVSTFGAVIFPPQNIGGSAEANKNAKAEKRLQRFLVGC